MNKLTDLNSPFGKFIINNIKMKYFQFFYLFLALLILSLLSCDTKKNSHSIAASDPSTSNYFAAQILKTELENNTRFKLNINEGLYTSSDNLLSVYNQESDFGIIQNTIDYSNIGVEETELNKNIRTVLPLYDQVLFIIYRNQDHQDNLYDLLKGKRVGFGKENGGDAWLVKKIFDYLGIPDSIYTSVYSSYDKNIVGNEIDISCSVTSYNNPRIVEMLEYGNNKMFSFENSSNMDYLGSAVNGIGLKNTTLSQFIIPKRSYGMYPKQPVLTICTQAVLVCHKNLHEDITHKMIEDIITHKTLISNTNPIYDKISENFDPHRLRFPLHLGVKIYFDRNKPGFLEKYAEVMALIVTILALVFGGISSLRNWQRMKKKNRIDVYYQKVIDLDNKIIATADEQELRSLENKLFALRDNAFEQLIQERLIADESFNIFLRLMEASIRRIKNQLSELAKSHPN